MSITVLVGSIRAVPKNAMLVSMGNNKTVREPANDVCTILMDVIQTVLDITHI